MRSCSAMFKYFLLLGLVVLLPLVGNPARGAPKTADPKNFFRVFKLERVLELWAADFEKNQVLPRIKIGNDGYYKIN